MRRDDVDEGRIVGDAAKSDAAIAVRSVGFHGVIEGVGGYNVSMLDFL